MVITCKLEVSVTVEFDDNESTAETVRYCIEEDLKDMGWECEVRVI